MPSPIDFQDIILKLQVYWAEKGCMIGQPYYTQVGAGTMNPATFLRVLGPEPWNVGYVEPSIRPDDGRYGENPNRYQQHTQFQVILKPDPGNPVELYLQSLEALGIDLRQHDIRLVEDNWEQPAISAWGLGWEIWLDGQEITQFTYFQQVGGQTLDPVAVEITYGLERILIALRNAPAIWNEPWNETVTYGEVRRRDEFEHSKYYFEVADVERLRQMFALFETEADACLAQGLVVPAYDYVLKCSHAFNVLDTRGAVGVTERQAFFGRMRDLSRRVAEAYAAQRKELEYPLLKRAAGGAAVAVRMKIPVVKAAAPFLLEIGVEELPSRDLDSALGQLEAQLPDWLEGLSLDHGPVRLMGTPRRLVVYVEDMAPRQADREELIKGPPEARAFGPDGVPTPAAIGFARSKGILPKDLQVAEIDGGRYAVARLRQAGRPTPEVLSEALPGLVAGIKFEKSMRWNDSGQAFARPVRWLVALLGQHVVPFEYALLRPGRVSRGMRPYGSPELIIPSAGEYFEIVQKNGILIDRDKRRSLIEAGVRKLAASVGGEAIMPAELLAEVANLVEKPTPLLASFEREYLALPREVLISVMEKHQRYFPIQKDGKLLPYFVVVRNGDRRHLDLVRQGNEHVVGARFADANFFVREDLKHTLEDFRPRLATLIFQKKLGSMLEKSERIEKLTAALVPLLAMKQDQADVALRAAHLCKADLMTRMVVEMTSLQGIIGREYALRSGENRAVAEAIGEQYQSVPATRPGLVVALADRLDSLVGLFAVGLVPTGTKDPFGLRRAALGVVQPLMEHRLPFNLKAALELAAGLEPIPAGREVQLQVMEFLLGRLRVLLIESGARYDIVDAVLVAQGHDPAASAQAVQALSAWASRPDWNGILPAYARCVRITRDQKAKYEVLPAAFSEPAEQGLFAALRKAESSKRRLGSVDDFLKAFEPMIPAVNVFFDQVLVMAEDPTLRENRLGLLQRIVGLADGTVDLSKMEGF